MNVKIFNQNCNVKDFSLVVQTWFNESQKAKFGLNVDMFTLFFDITQLATSASSDVLVLEDNGTIVGFFGISASQSKFSKQKIAEERYYYVLPESRGRSSLKLLKAAEDWAKNKQCSHFIMYASQLASELHDRTCKLYGKLGMKQFETSYIKEL